MGHLCSFFDTKKTADFRLCKVNGRTTELLEIVSDNPSLHVVFVPGNPGIVTLYKDFVESLYDILEGKASVTAVGHISFSIKNWERGKLFSLQQQIDHKVDFIEQECQKIPVFLIGHSIGAYMVLEALRRLQGKVVYMMGLYPFLKLNPSSEKQKKYCKLAKNVFRSTFTSFSISLLGYMPMFIRRLVVSNTIGKCWSSSTVDAACSHLVKYHTFRNMLYLANSEFQKLSEDLDWEFIKANESTISFLFGLDDHWGPMQMYEEINLKVPNMELAVEKEGHTHSFCVTEAGSLWVAQHVATSIKSYLSKSTA